jgi:hypothetical protein
MMQQLTLVSEILVEAESQVAATALRRGDLPRHAGLKARSAGMGDIDLQAQVALNPPPGSDVYRLWRRA